MSVVSDELEHGGSACTSRVQGKTSRGVGISTASDGEGREKQASQLTAGSTPELRMGHEAARCCHTATAHASYT